MNQSRGFRVVRRTVDLVWKEKNYEVKQSIRTFSSTWNLPWSTLDPQVMKKQRQLKDLLSNVVRSHLESQYSEAFAVKTSREFWLPSISLVRKPSTDTKQEDRKTVPISNTLKTLASLNGFKVVPLPTESVSLAEGILVKPQYPNTSRNNSPMPILWAREEEQIKTKNVAKLPTLIEEDVKLYRILENKVEEILNGIQLTISQVLSFGREKEKIPEKESLPLLIVSQDTKEDVVMTENLLTIDEDELIWISNMEHPSLRLLALTNHHTYGHKAASTLISVSLVVFGALPLTYRSFVFALNYPGLSQAVATSVLVTVSYGIWSTRSIAVTSQSRVVANGISHRIYARNDAVLWALQEGAIQRITDGILTHYYNHKDDQVSKERKVPITSINLLELSQDIGLIQKCIGEEQWVSLSLDDAINLLNKRHQ